MYTKRLVSLLLLFGSLCVQAQENCGCQQAEGLRASMGMYFNSGRLDSAEYFTNQLLTFSEKGCLIYFEDWMAQIELGRKNFTSARTHLLAEGKLLEKYACGPALYIRHFNAWSRLYQDLNQADSFIIACLKGVDVSEQAADYYGLSRACSDVAAAFSQLGQNSQAIFYYRKAMSAAKRQKVSPSLLASVQTRMANEYLGVFRNSQNKLYADSAAALAREAMDTAGKYKDLLAFLEANETLAGLSVLKKEYAKAISYADVLISNSPKGVHLFDRLIYAGYSVKSEAGFGLKDFNQAGQFADSAMLYAQAFNPQMMVGAYEKIYQSAKANGDKDRSLSAFEKLVLLKDSLYSIEKNKTVSELEKKYNQAKNENTIRDLDRKKQLYLLLAVSGLLAVLVIAYFVRHQSLKHRHLLLEAEQRLNRARMNPHFFFNSLTALQKFSVRETNPQLMTENLAKFSRLMRETLESTYKEFVTVEQEMEYLNEYLEVQGIRLQSDFSYTVAADSKLEINECLIPPMIIQPFIENSIEHGFAGLTRTAQLSVYFGLEKNELLVEITDNGKGLPDNATKNGEHISRATQIIKDRILLLNSKLKSKAWFLVSNNEKTDGVTVLIHLPLIWNNELNGQA